MTSVRQDAWTKDEDLLLAEVVLRHIREGSTQLKAFDEVGKKLNRTAAACGFRWNSTVRKQYQSAIELAKKQRKEGKRGIRQNTGELEAVSEQGKKTSIRLEDVIEFLQNMKEREHLFEANLENTENNYQEKLLFMENRLKELEKENEKLVKENKELKDEYVSLLTILEKARTLTKTEKEEMEKE
ncbi:RsfA family transcriptional regulator [Fervidibacillus halotolerans]|uniref:RsfA family transcriptional regulator n=1 Tax=Fervidibacillus halotolerans TaxID=2980027 RepID=A0A9E8RZT5_9BACI|nr:RsfA family transcriptional regulator [Fervidibacillus halotolerans]WAA13698.1 RsfA family transcriptional regulator [Fervidibacillus halotolerans]